MKSIEELQADLKQLYSELEERRIMEQESVPQTVNFEELSSKAERCKIENHPMSNRDEHEQSMYLLLLISVIVLDETSYENSFSLLYRILHGMNFKGDVQELFLQAQQINFERIDDITRLFIKDDVRLLVLMEAMMIVQGFKKEYKKAMEYIAELCILMKLEKEQVILISNIARAVLTQDVKEYKCDIKNTYNTFNCYLYQLEKNKKLEIIFIRKDCKQYTSHESRRVTTYQGKTYSNSFDVLHLTYSRRNGTAFQYSYPSSISYVCSGGDSTTTNYGERTVDLFKVQNGHECVCFKEKITDGEPFSNVLVAVTSNAPNLAYSLTMKRYKEAGGIT